MKKSNNIEVLHVSSVHSVRDPRIFEKEARSLFQAGFAVTIVATGEKTESTIVDDIRLDSIKSGGRFYRFSILQFRLARAISRKSHAIVHLHDPDLIILGWIYSKLGRKVIYDVHENYAHSILAKDYIPKPFRKFIACFFNALEKGMSKNFSAIVLADTQLQTGFKNKNIAVVRNYPILENLPKSQNNQSLWNNQNHLRMVYVGSITRARGAIVMADVVYYLSQMTDKKVTLDLVGEMHVDISDHPVAQSIISHGYQNFERARSIMAEAAVGLCILQPTKAYKEAVPVKLLEYLGIGLPCVVSDFPRIRQLSNIAEGCIFVDPSQAEEIAKKILFEWESGGLVRRRGIVAEKLLQSHSWQSEQKKLVDAYINIV